MLYPRARVPSKIDRLLNELMEDCVAPLSSDDLFGKDDLLKRV